MSLDLRCPNCRTPLGLSQAARCFACGAERTVIPVAALAEDPPALGEARRDRGLGRVVLAVIGLLCLLGILAALLEPGETIPKLITVGVVAVIVIVGAIGATRGEHEHETSLADMATGGLKALATVVLVLVGLVIGLLVLLWAACMLGFS